MKFDGVLLSLSGNTVTIHKDGNKYYEYNSSLKPKIDELLSTDKRYHCEFEATPKSKVIFSINPLEEPPVFTQVTESEPCNTCNNLGARCPKDPMCEKYAEFLDVRATKEDPPTTPKVQVHDPETLPINHITVSKKKKVPGYTGKKLGSISIGAKIKIEEHESLFIQVEGDDANATLAHLNDILDTIGDGASARSRIESYQNKVLRQRKEE